MDSIQACTNRLCEIAEVISRLSDDEFASPLPVLNMASLGAHTRHVLEFYECLLSQRLGGEINYDLRKRDFRLERSVSTVEKTIGKLTGMLAEIHTDQSLKLRANFSQDTDRSELIETSLHRELVYQLEHTIHHMALIRVGLHHAFPHIDLPDSFGVAASTLRYSHMTQKQ